MTESFSSQRVAILVDVPNLYHAAKMRCQARVQYDKLLDGLRCGRQVVRSLAFLVQRPDVQQNGFLEALSRFGFETRVQETKMRLDTEQKPVPTRASPEIPITIEALTLASKVDVVIIVSGDGCYVPLVEALRMRGCRVEVAAVDGSLASELQKVADKFLPITSAWMLPEKEKSAQTVQVINNGGPRQDPKFMVPAMPVAPAPNFDEEQPLTNTARPILARR